MITSIRGLLAATALAGACFAAPAFADEAAPPSDFTITGSAAIVSQYRFRGLSRSDNKPAVQGAITVSHASGFYVSTWGSSASAGNGPIDIGGTEIDVYGGYTHTFSGLGLTTDMGVYGYLYPGATAGNYYEVYGSLAQSYGPVTAKVGVNFAPAQKVFNVNFTTASRSNAYVYGELGTSIPGTPLSLHSHLGHTGGGFDYGKPYLDYNVGVTAKWKNLALDASIVGTNISRSDVLNGFASYINSDCGSLNPTNACVASNVTYFRRPAKTVGVVSLTASF